MLAQLKRMDVEAAKEDLRIRTLGPIGYEFGRLLYLASTRDYTSGEYHHYGLERLFSELAAREALAACHQEVFYGLAICSLKSLVLQVERFMLSGGRDLQNSVNAWENLEVYRLTVPNECDRLTAGLLLSNIKIAMALLKSRPPAQPLTTQSASPRPSLGRQSPLPPGTQKYASW
jgi:hypothetical protein